MNLSIKLALTSATTLSLLSSANGVMITVDYTYDTNNFFDTPAKQAAMQRAADRWSSVLADGNLGAAEINDSNDGRIGFTHPGTGADFQLSGAASFGSDDLSGAGAADGYGTISFAADTWILYAGGRALGSAGIGGTGTGINFTGSVHENPVSHLNRGFNNGFGSLPVWGGAISFNTGTAWDFTDDASGSGTDFYTIALHEIGHGLGLSTDWDDFEANQSGASFTGPNSLAALNADNGTSATSLNLVSSTNTHWQDGTYQSNIFEFGNPDYDGTVGAGNPQDLIMDPVANFGGGIDRLELTNVDVALAQDIGWVVVPEPSSTLLICFGSFAFFLRRRK